MGCCPGKEAGADALLTSVQIEVAATKEEQLRRQHEIGDAQGRAGK